MNYNEHNCQQQEIVLKTEEDEENEIKEISSQPLSSKMTIPRVQAKNLKKPLIDRNKENISHEIFDTNTNHSFNQAFYQSYKNSKLAANHVKIRNNEFINKQNSMGNIQLKSIEDSELNYSTNGRLSNLPLPLEANTNDYKIHSQTRKFIIKYFPDNYQTEEFYTQYVTLNDFVDILLEEYENVVGKDNIQNIIVNFSNKIFQTFGENIFFSDLIERTKQKGLIGLIFQVFKSIEEDGYSRISSKNSNPNLKSYFMQQNQNRMNDLDNYKPIKNSFQSQLKENTLYSSKMSNNRSQTSKISLDSFFSSSKIHLSSEMKGINNESLTQIKLILQEYIQNMYQEAQFKLLKRSNQQIKRINLKYKQAQKLLITVNEKVSNHFDSITLQKDYQLKFKSLKDKQHQLQTQISTLQQQLRISRDQVVKQKASSSKLSLQMDKLNKKLQKYEQVLLMKAIQKTPHNPHIGPIRTEVINDKIEPRIDHMTISNVSNTSNISQGRSYSPYLVRQVTIPSIQNSRSSISPMNQRISFNRTPNPHLKISNVQRIEVGQPVHIRPLSPIGKLIPQNKPVFHINKEFSTSRVISISPFKK